MTKKSFIILMVIVISMICVGVLVYLNFYKNNVSLEEVNANPNKYANVKISKEQVFNNYINELISMIEKNEWDKIDLILDREDGSKYRSLTSQEIENDVKSLNILGSKLEIIKCKKINDKNWNNIYNYTVKNGENEEVIISIKEKSPNVYYVEMNKTN